MNVAGYTRLTTSADVDNVLARTDGKESFMYVSGSNCPGCTTVYPTIKDWPTTYPNIAFYEMDVTSAAHGNDALYVLGGNVVPAGIIFKNYNTMTDPQYLVAKSGATQLLGMGTDIATYQ